MLPILRERTTGTDLLSCQHMLLKVQEFAMRTIKILQIGDMQNGFVHEDGNLYVRGASAIIRPANHFLAHVPDGYFDYVLVILDTHFAEEYHGSEESMMFPLHCEYGTGDWELAVDVSGLKNRMYLMKNRFNMWSGGSGAQVVLSDRHTQEIHDRLFCFLDSIESPEVQISRDEFISSVLQESEGGQVEVTLFGVASDFCNRYAMDGWLDRGARVTVLADLTKGIEKETDEVLSECAYRHYSHDRLRLIRSEDYLKELSSLIP